jgi:cation diffusion facilitator CzcD-associated flavoprotein CzcO
MARHAKAPSPTLDFDAVIIGAGVAGLCALHRLIESGLSVRGFERGGDVGGVWYWNRYPGARFDSESYTYCYSFSPELLAEWNWREHFAAQPEIHSYLRHVAERFDLRRHIGFDTEVVSAHYDDDHHLWRVTTDRGEVVRSRYLISCAGALSTPQLPDIDGITDFAGVVCHTARWPAGGVNLTGQRVGVIGTGATGVQVIQTIAAEVAHLTVFQRTPTYCIPQRNAPIGAAEMRDIKRRYPELFARCRASFGGFVHDFDPRSGLAVSAEERLEKFETLWQQPGFAFWFGNFADLMMDATVNEYACEFLRSKIRARVRDPAVAAKLLPTHPFGTKRVPLENGYYEVFNRDNVDLVDLRESPLTRITPAGARTRTTEHLLDVLIFATGFDAVTGALTRIDIRGEQGRRLTDKWQDGPISYLGLQVSGFPNLFTIAGPNNAANLCNAVRCTEQNIDWVTACIRHMREQGRVRMTATAEAEHGWMQHVQDIAGSTLLESMTDSWFYGANTPGKPRRLMIYPGGAVTYREQCERVAAGGYAGFEFG